MKDSPSPSAGLPELDTNSKDQLNAAYRRELDFEGLRVVANTQHKNVLKGVTTTVPVLFQLAGGRLSSETLPFDLAVLLDVSGSMAGNRIECAKAAMDAVIDSMRDGDRLHLITYSLSASVVFTNATLSDRNELHKRVGALQPTGGTNLGCGLELCSQLLRTSLGPQDSRAVFVFSDGETNQGITSSAELERLVERQLVAQQVAVHAFGIGPDYREQSLFGLSRVGNGGAYHIRSSNDIEAVVSKGLRGLAGMLVRDATLSIRGVGHCSVIGFRSGDGVSDGADSSTPSYKARVRALRSGGLVQLLADLDVRVPGNAETTTDAEIARWTLVGADGSTEVSSGSLRIGYVDEPAQIGDANAEVAAYLAMREAIRLEAEAKRQLDSGDLAGGLETKKRTVALLREAPAGVYHLNEALAIDIAAQSAVLERHGYTVDERKAAAARQDYEDSDGDMGFGLFD